MMKKWAAVDIKLDAVEKKLLQLFGCVAARKGNVRLQVTFADHEKYLSTQKFIFRLTCSTGLIVHAYNRQRRRDTRDFKFSENFHNLSKTFLLAPN